MSFRRSKEEAFRTREWKEFCAANDALVRRAGLPDTTYETRERFEDFLMHGYLDHHEDAARFAVRQMTEEQYDAFKRLVRAYFAAGHANPGLHCFKSERDMRELTTAFPAIFAPRRG